MDEKQRKVIQIHRKFLEKNIVWTDDLVSKLKEEGFITDSLLRDTQNAKSRAEKVSKFIDLLLVRSVPKGFERFCDVLHATGHCFVAEFLRDAECQGDIFNTKELYQHMKFLEKLKDHEKKDLENFFLTKFREESLKLVWKDDVRDREKAVEAKRMLIEQHDDHRVDTMKWSTEVHSLEDQLQFRKDEIASLNVQIRLMRDTLREQTEKHKGDISSQLRYTHANESQLSKANEKLEHTENMLREINKKLAGALKSRPRDLSKMSKDEAVVVSNEFAFMKHDMERLLEKHEELKEIGLKYFDLCDQRDYILTHMGYEPQKEGTPSLLDAYRDFAANTDETMSELRDKLAEYGEMVESHKKKMQDTEDKKKAFQLGTNVWQAAIMNVMRQQLQDIKRESRMKDTRIQLAETENQKMKAKVSELEEEVHKMKRSKSKETKASREYLSIEHINGPLSVTSDGSDNLDDVDSDSENRKSKKPRFPPLNKNAYQAPTYAVQLHHTPSPRKNKVHHIEGSTNKYSSTKAPALPDGLTTSTVRLERRNKYLQNNPHMVHGLGDLQAMNARSKFEKSLNPAKVKY